MSDRHIAGPGGVARGGRPAGPRRRVGAALARPFYWTSGLICGLALLSAISSLWSGSIELSVIEADRVLVYLGFFLAAFLIAQTDERRQRFAEGIAIAVTLVALLGLGSRLLPHVLNVGTRLGTGPRLRYPLGYWNANGAMCGIAVAMLLWMSRRSPGRRPCAGSRSPRCRRCCSPSTSPTRAAACWRCWSPPAACWRSPATGSGCWRRWRSARSGTLPAVLAVQARHSLADNLANQPSVDQGVTVLLILLGGHRSGAAAVRRPAPRSRAGDGELTGRAVELSRNPNLLKGDRRSLGAIAAIGVAIAVGGRAWHQFSSSDLQFPNNPEQHFGQLSGAGRHDFWRVAIDAFGEKPVLGHGAGTYEFSWEQHRSIRTIPVARRPLPLPARPSPSSAWSAACSCWAWSGRCSGCGFAAWRAAPRRRSASVYAALLAAMLAFAVGAAIDWFWEIAALGAIFFLAGGRSGRGPLRPARRPARRRGRRGRRRATLRARGRRAGDRLDHRPRADRAAAGRPRDQGQPGGGRRGQPRRAPSTTPTRPARSSPGPPPPTCSSGLLAELQGDYATATERLTQAIEREDRNWQLYYLRSKVEHEAGDAAAAGADIGRVRQQLNPVSRSCLREGADR